MTHFTHAPASALFAAAMIFASFSPSDSHGQAGVSARQAYNTVPVQFGPQAAQWIAEMQGVNGIPQPSVWHILAYDPQAAHLLRRYWSAEGRAGDNGPDLERYPGNVPVGYFNINQLGVDSVAAFTIAEGEARKARMGFDSCSYLLRVREYSSEPIWRLELIDVNRRTVGKVYISGQNGEVLRTVWIDFNNGGKITDSSAPGNRPAAVNPGLSSTGQPSINQPGAITGNYTGPPPVLGQGGSTGRVPATTGKTTGTMKPFSPVPPAGTIPPPTTPKPDPVATTRPPTPATKPIPDLREMPQKPASKPKPTSKPPVPTSSSSSGRIPPPPIPPGQ